MGIHCAAKRVDSQAALQWLTASAATSPQGAALRRHTLWKGFANSPDPTNRVALVRSI